MSVVVGRTWLAGVLAGALLVACGGSGRGKGQPLSPENASGIDEGADGGSDFPASAFSASDSDAGAPASSGVNEPPASSPSDTPAPAPAPAAASILQNNEDGARALLSQFVAPNADPIALTRSLRPTSSDYKTLFDAKTAPKIEAAQAKDWNSNKAVIKAKPGQTEVKVWSATGSDLAKGVANAKEFPADYKKVAKHLSPTVLFFRFKFVEPGKDVGTAYDGLAFVNGHWVIAPKPWRALEGKAGGMDDEAAEAAAPQKPAGKKKPKGGKKK
jgi:hypothetical protein